MHNLRNAAAALAALVMFAGAAGAAEYESPPVLKAADLAGDIPLKGERYRVDDEVPTDGYLATFTLRTDFGKVEARGPGALRRSVAEVDALAALEKIKKSDVFADALKRSATAMGGAVANVVTNTAEVAKAVPASVGRFFGRVAQSTKTAAQKLGDVNEGREPGAARGAEASTNQANVAVAGGVAAGKAVRDVLGYDEQRRHLAKSVAVDPYTTNPLLKEKLDDIAWAAFAGGLGVDVVASAVPGGRLLRSSSVLTDWVYDKPPGDLRVWIDKTLTDMGVDRETVDLFLRLKAFTLTSQMALVMALEQMKDVEGRVKVLELAVTLETYDQALFLAASLCMLAREHKATPLKEILDGRPVGVTKDGRVVVCVAADYVCWSQKTADFAGREDLVSRKPALKICGLLSPEARRQMESLGWKLHERVPLAGSL
jgi:hypothetical protein